MAITAILFSPLSATSSFISQLHTFSSAQPAGVGDKVHASIRTAPNLLLLCEQPLLSVSNNSCLWDNVNALARCGDDRRYLQVNVQATGNYMVAVIPIVRGEKLEVGSAKLKRGRLDTLPPRTAPDINQLVDTVSLRDLSPDQLIQLTQFRQAWRVKTGQRVNAIASGYGVSANAEGQASNNVVVAQNARVRMVSGQVANDVIDTGGNILISLQTVKDNPSFTDK